MVDYKPDVPNSPHLDGVFQALSDPTRRAMLQALAEQPRTVGELAAPFEISLAGASKHIQVLERAGLIHREVQGRVHTCHPDARPLHAGAEWIRHYERSWNRQRDALEAPRRTADDHPGKTGTRVPPPAHNTRTKQT